MKLAISGTRYHLEIINGNKQETVVFIHGFTGSTKSWQPVIEAWDESKIVLIDLIGHGETDCPETVESYSMEQQLEDLDALFEQLDLERLTLVGYSMGGRTALAYACRFPGRIKALVLESASPGLRSETERQERRTRDEGLAERIVAGGIENFVGRWEKIPLFDSQKSLPDSLKRNIREERLAQNPVGLANSLRGMGTGAQASYWGRLAELDMPVLLVTGRLDEKFEAIAAEMMKLLPNAVHKTIDAGHAIHVEKPVEFATIVREYLSLNYQGGKS
ncbi:2-succinyl-6-hydroxy-2,4-cyclohexadiene-1-carboxylate synthase [Planomicrobium stackebrandtii]|uniref:Putative 2-succinyl-6-hydroxy-2,4-cyclohexadiene-1-carboxylate synthase n=1 Tax=Planomicrobium stackebrandtii TaxID=253160 RepID=A0ABU0GYE7_9BACL|nr:2-succinyl-6-hydroxy-2,4-cyclohexadiene-1-carboxylate synthase [Planomicrobium stackebrandtii]MDQ0430385.1 2-succinyl-6-hydroxy-2,4-cyclohexadiene-1-carboxylate synthase [Planomicrobium stackebrandtii]